MQEFHLERNGKYEPDEDYQQSCPICGAAFHPGPYVIIYNDSIVCDECGDKYTPDIFSLLVITKRFCLEPGEPYAWHSKKQTDENYKQAEKLKTE